MGWVRRLRNTILSSKVDEQFEEEARFHLEQRTEEYVRSGMTIAEAQREARRRLGNLTLAKEWARDVDTFRWLEDCRLDLQYAFRTLRTSPGFTAVALLSLGLGIGANTAIFSLLDAVLLKSLPVKNPEELVVLRTGDFSYPAFQAFRRENNAFVDLFATSGITEQNVELGHAMPERTSLSLVSGSYFMVLGVSAIAGRTFTADDDRVPGGAPVAVASYGYWQRRFGRDPSVLGQTIRVSGTPITIIGVVPPGFFGERVGASPDLWLPLTMWAQVVPGRDLLQSPATAWLGVIGRLNPGADLRRTESTLTLVYRQALTDTFGPHVEEDIRRDITAATVRLEPANKGLSSLRRQFSRPLQIVMAIVALLLMIACANVANLLLARASARRREIALRLALGISRGRLVRQLLTESLLLSGLGGVVGLLLAVWGREVLLRLISGDGSPLPLATGLDSRLLAFVLATSAGTGVLFGLVPALQFARVTEIGILDRIRSTTGPSERRAMSRALVIGQVAVALVLLVGAGLFLRTLANLRDVDLGFVPDRLVIVDVNPRAIGYQGTRYVELCRRLLSRLQATPGVTSVTLSENGVLSGRDSSTHRMRPKGFSVTREGIPSARFDMVGPAYFGTMGISRLAGRDIEQRDDMNTPRVVAINEMMAQRFFPNASPVGQRMIWGSGEREEAWEVVAVVRDVKQHSPRDESRLRFYIPYFQRADAELASVRFVVRTAASPEATITLLRRAITAEDGRLPIISADTVAALTDRTVVQERMVAMLSTVFGTLAVGLACLGIYGVIAYRVVHRTTEIGIRMALGADHRQVLWMILRQDAGLIALGIVIGVPTAIATSRVAQSLLFGVGATDPTTIGIAALVMATVGLAAGLIPARRATLIEPSLTLRQE